MIPLTDEENKCYDEQEVCHICKKIFVYIKMMKMMKMIKMMKIKMTKLLKLMKNLKSTKKLKVSAITPGNLEELLIAFAIWDIKYRKILQ